MPKANKGNPPPAVDESKNDPNELVPVPMRWPRRLKLWATDHAEGVKCTDLTSWVKQLVVAEKERYEARQGTTSADAAIRALENPADSQQSRAAHSPHRSAQKPRPSAQG